jgi:hypothetical protein
LVEKLRFTDKKETWRANSNQNLEQESSYQRLAEVQFKVRFIAFYPNNKQMHVNPQK